MWLIRKIVVGSAVLLCWSAAARGAVEYRITALDVLPGRLDSLAFGLNDRGQIVGASNKDRSGHIGQSRPVVWDFSGVAHELWSDQSIGGSLADINNAGEIVGRYGSGSGVPLPGPGVPFGRAFYWSAGTGRRDIGFESVGNSQAVAINESGQVVGTSERLELVEVEVGAPPQELFIPHPFIWDAVNGIRDLGTLGGYGGFATDVNNAGQVVGYADLPNGYERAFVWDEAQGIQELPTIAGGETRARAINNLGQILGSEIGIGGIIWDWGIDITPDVSGGRDLNDFGQSVGGASIEDPGYGVRPLSDLIPPESGWQIENVFAINNRGEIVGYGLLDGRVRGFVMTPVPEPAATQLAVVALLLSFLLACRDRRFTAFPVKKTKRTFLTSNRRDPRCRCSFGARK